jgi:ribonuclease HIII
MPAASYPIRTEDRPKLQATLLAAGARDSEEGQHEAWRLRLATGSGVATIILYQSGRLIIAGAEPAVADATALIAAYLPVAGSPPSADLPAGLTPDQPHIGTDEAGKGDFFGPLVVAGVYTEGRMPDLLRELGVRDSKTLSDGAVQRIAADVRHAAAGKLAVIAIAPKRYNALLRDMVKEGKNLNTLLAWGHTRSIEDLVKAGLKPSYVISDQFGDKRYIEQRLLAETRLRAIPIVQMPRAESDVAVAAASILARDAFLRWLARATKDLGMPLPKGASTAVVTAGRQIASRRGADALEEYAKTSFRTMQQVLKT